MKSDELDELKRLMNSDELTSINPDALNQSQRQGLLSWGLRMYRMGRAVVGDIERIKYEGQLVILEDGSRWAVDSTDALTADMWSPLDKVAVIDGEMFRLDDLEKVHVEEEID